MKPRIAFFAIALLCLAACGGTTTVDTDAASGAETASFVLATPNEAAGIIDSRLGSDGFVLLDVRTPQEYAEGHIAGSDNIDFYEGAFAANIAELDRDASYVVYCRSGNRSGQTIELMQELGFTNVTDISGGIVAWQESGLPVE